MPDHSESQHESQSDQEDIDTAVEEVSQDSIEQSPLEANLEQALADVYGRK